MKKRILWVSFALTAVALLIFSVFSAEIYYRSSLRHAEGFLRACSGAFDETRGIDELTEEYAAELSRRLDGARVTFLSAEGAFLADSEDKEDSDRSGRPEVAEAISGGNGEGFDVRASSTLGTDLIYYCRAFSEQGYLVRIAVPTYSFWGIYADSLPTVAAFLLLDAVICLLFTYLFTGFMLRPLDKLARDAAVKKKLETDCSELDGLVQVLNGMNEEAAAHLRELAEEKNLTEKAQRSKNDFIANITHEMNTPLTSIRGFAELLAAGSLQGEAAERAARTVLSQSERLSNLIACIINYNEIDSDELPSYEVNASRIAEETLESLSPALKEKKLVLLSEIEPDVLLMSRQERVAEVFGNLIRNAIRYNREGGSVTVLLTHQMFRVSDTGIGIAEENLERIFDRFFTVDKSHGGKNGGFGLGLSVVKKLCEKAGWKLSVQSKEGAGTAFTVEFS